MRIFACTGIIDYKQKRSNRYGHNRPGAKVGWLESDARRGTADTDHACAYILRGIGTKRL